MFRVFDQVEHRWVRENIFLTPMNDLYILNKASFGRKKLEIVSETRYTIQNDIGLYDVNRKRIFEGDIGKISSPEAIGIITYIPEKAFYCLLDEENMKYYPLSEERCKEMEVIGNIFENIDLLHSHQGDGQ